MVFVNDFQLLGGGVLCMVQKSGYLVEIVKQDGYLAERLQGDFSGPLKALNCGSRNARQVR